jgi:hypothetical protein
MASRFYLSRTQAPAVTPAFEAWTRTSEALRREMHTTADGSTISGLQFWGNAAAAANDTCLAFQFVSRPLAAGVAFATSDTIKCYALCNEGATNDNINRQPIAVKVVSQDGNTLRATLKALGHIGPNTNEWTTPVNTNKTWADGDALTANYTTVAGDRLVVEIGGQVSSAAGTTVQGTIFIGSGGSGGDVGENETDTLLTLNPWFEISRTVTFLLAGDIAASEPLIFGEAAVLTASGALAGTADETFGDSAALTGAGGPGGPPNPALTQYGLPVFGATEPFLTADGRHVFRSGVVAFGLTVDAEFVFNLPVAALPAGDIAGTIANIFANSGTLTGAAAIAGITAQAFTNTGTLAGAGALAGVSFPTFANTGAMAGGSALIGTAGQVFANTGLLTASAVLAAADTLTFGESAVLTGSAAILGVAAQGFGETAALGASGALAGTALQAFANSGFLAQPPGAAFGLAAQVFANAGTLSATAQLAALAAQSFANSGALTLGIALAGSAAQAFTTSGTLAAPAALSALSALSFTNQGVLLADGALAGESVLEFLAQALLIDQEAATDAVKGTISDRGIGRAGISARKKGAASIRTGHPILQ